MVKLVTFKLGEKNVRVNVRRYFVWPTKIDLSST